MKKLFCIIILMLSLCINTQAQGQNQRPRPDFNMILEKRYEYITHELSLDENKAKTFKPVYMEYCKKMWELFKFDPSKRKPKEQRTDAEVEQDIKADFTRAKKIVTIRETYYAKFKKILSPKQIEKIYEIERREQQMMANRRNKNKGGKPQ